MTKMTLLLFRKIVKCLTIHYDLRAKTNGWILGKELPMPLPCLAAFQSQTDYSIYRRFDLLCSRLCLRYQEKLEALETRLRIIDREEAASEDTVEGIAPEDTFAEETGTGDATIESLAEDAEDAVPEDTAPENTAPGGTAAEAIAPENGRRRSQEAGRLMYNNLSREQVFEEMEKCLQNYCQTNPGT
jgi:hypothetical protein